MSQSATRLSLDQARKLAAAVISELAVGCARIEPAGSLRRARPDVGDLELCAVPLYQPDLFGGEAVSILDGLLRDLEHQGRLRRLKSGPRYKQYELPKHGRNLDLFVTTPEQWGLIHLIRTGPQTFSKRVVTQRSKGGFLPDDCQVRDGWLLRDGQPVATPTEEELFVLLGIDFIPPEGRA